MTIPIILGFIGSMLLLWCVIFGGVRAIMWVGDFIVRKRQQRKDAKK